MDFKISYHKGIFKLNEAIEISRLTRMSLTLKAGIAIFKSNFYHFYTMIFSSPTCLVKKIQVFQKHLYPLHLSATQSNQCKLSSLYDLTPGTGCSIETRFNCKIIIQPPFPWIDKLKVQSSGMSLTWRTVNTSGATLKECSKSKLLAINTAIYTNTSEAFKLF